MMWIDGVLDIERWDRLSSEGNIVDLVQYQNYAVAAFSSKPKRNWYRYLDPNKFAVQMTLNCDELEINFNPTPEQVERLREWRYRLRLSITAS